ncbi:hypothetical protein ACA910_007061 [Epithemia clementina (nom. ined.)]
MAVISNSNRTKRGTDVGVSSSSSFRMIALMVMATILLIAYFISWSQQPTSHSLPHSVVNGNDILDTQRLCTQNPYLAALADPAVSITKKVEEWLTHGRIIQGTIAADPTYDKHDHKRFFPFTPTTECLDKQCIGGPCSSDTSKIVCGLNQLKQVPSKGTNEGTNGEHKCIIYSIGGNNLWSFELDLLADTPCDIHTFDCTGNYSRFQVPNNPRLFFHHVCLSPYPINPKLERPSYMVGESWTLLEMQQKLNHSRIDLLKVDIEGYEHNMFHSWPILADLKASREMLLPMQIVVEIHYVSQFKDLHQQAHPFKTASDMVALQAQFMRMGYVVTIRDDNPHCPHCTELTLIRVHCPGTGAYAN